MANGLKALRERARLTQEQAADRFGLSPSGYARIERGGRRLTYRYIEKACEVFGADVREVLTDLARHEAVAAAALPGTPPDARQSPVDPYYERHKINWIPSRQMRPKSSLKP